MIGRKFIYIANLMILNCMIKHGFRGTYRRTLEIYTEIEDLLYGRKVEPPPPNDYTDVIDIHERLSALHARRGETTKSHDRRQREGWYERYAPEDRSGIDIGCQYDPINETFRRWDQLFGDGDAALMEGVPDQVFNTVYASHVLEHLIDPVLAVKNWYRILQEGGHLIILVPHRDLYEKRKNLPSQWNPDHKWMWLPDLDEEPHTLSLKGVLRKAGIEDAEIVSLKILDEGYDSTLPADVHAVGEFSIEAIIKKSIKTQKII